MNGLTVTAMGAITLTNVDAVGNNTTGMGQSWIISRRNRRDHRGRGQSTDLNRFNQ